MNHFRVGEISKDKPYVEFLRTLDLSAGVYRLAAGATDSQDPHSEEEIYYVLAGHARFESGGGDVAVKPGDLLFVPTGEHHKFHDITQDLELLVLFAPAEGTR